MDEPSSGKKLVKMQEENGNGRYAELISCPVISPMFWLAGIIFLTIFCCTPVFAMSHFDSYKTLDITIHDDGSYQLKIYQKHIFTKDDGMAYNSLDLFEKLSPGSSDRAAETTTQFLREIIQDRGMTGVEVERSYISNGEIITVVNVEAGANTLDAAAFPQITKTSNGFDIYFPMGTWTDDTKDAELAKKIYAAGTQATGIENRILWTVTYNFPSSGTVKADIPPTSTTATSATWSTESSQYSSVKIPKTITFSKGIGISTDALTTVGIGAVVVGGALAALKLGGVIGGAKTGTTGTETSAGSRNSGTLSGSSGGSVASSQTRQIPSTYQSTNDHFSPSDVSGSSSAVTAEEPGFSLPTDSTSPIDLMSVNIESVDLLTTHPVVNSAVEYLLRLNNPTSLAQKIMVRPVARDAQGNTVAIEPFMVSLGAGEMVDTVFRIVPKLTGNYDLEVLTSVNDVPGASFIAKSLMVEGSVSTMELVSARLDSTNLAPKEQTMLRIVVSNSGYSAITISASAIISQNGEAVVENYVGEYSVPPGGRQEIAGSVSALDQEGRYDIDVAVRAGADELHSTLFLNVQSNVEAIILNMPEHFTAGERYTLHIEVANRGPARNYTVTVTGNGIDTVIRLVSLDTNGRKILPVDVVAKTTMGKSEMDMKIIISRD